MKRFSWFKQHWISFSLGVIASTLWQFFAKQCGEETIGIVALVSLAVICGIHTDREYKEDAFTERHEWFWLNGGAFGIGAIAGKDWVLAEYFGYELSGILTFVLHTVLCGIYINQAYKAYKKESSTDAKSEDKEK